MEATPLTLTIIAVFIGSPVLAIIVGKYVRPNASTLELLQEIQEERAEDRRRIEKLEEKVREIGRIRNRQSDYINVLRSHITSAKPPPPPPWPDWLA